MIHLRNDYKQVMAKIEKAVHAQFASQPTQAQASASSSTARQTETTQADTPFAKVNSVVANSPAADAGLQAGDKVARFGPATWLNHDKLAKVAQIVSQSEGVSVCNRGALSNFWHLTQFPEVNPSHDYKRYRYQAAFVDATIKLGRQRNAGLSSCSSLRSKFKCSQCSGTPPHTRRPKTRCEACPYGRGAPNA